VLRIENLNGRSILHLMTIHKINNMQKAIYIPNDDSISLAMSKF
jgi:hypothetical protein